MEDSVLFFSLVFLVGSSLLSGISTSLQILGKRPGKEELKKRSKLFFFQHILRAFVGSQFWEGLFFTISFTRHIFLLLYASCSFSYLLQRNFFSINEKIPGDSLLDIGSLVVTSIAVLIALSLVLDFSIRLLATLNPKNFIKATCLPVSIFLTPSGLITALFLHIIQRFFPKFEEDKNHSSSLKIREKFLEILDETELAPHLDYFDQRLILSIASFKDRIAREVMIPRIDVCALSQETPIKQAAHTFMREGYSRIPVYDDSIDNIVGILNYKDLLNIYATHTNDPQALERPIQSLAKSVIYAPETKKISHLLQQFRSQQTHIAIVVDEYGGTSGIITIEDILEELVGEISDEYDLEEEALFSALPDGGWIVDAKMTIIDIEKQIKIMIPQSPDYETIGGYISLTAGIIPPPGWKLHQDNFDLEVLSSTERSIGKIRIRPTGD